MAVMTIHRDEIEALIEEGLRHRGAEDAVDHLVKMGKWFDDETAAVSCSFTVDSLGRDLYGWLAALKTWAKRTES